MTYLREVVFTAIICGILTKLTSVGKSESGKYVKYVASLVFLYILVSPLINNTLSSYDITEDIRRIGENSEITNAPGGNYASSIEIVSNEICKAAARSAGENFSVDEEDFSIKVIFDISETDELSLKQATVYSSGTAADIEKAELEKYFREILNCPVEVIKVE